MTLLLDTHSWAWALTSNPRLNRTALAVLDAADLVLLSPISLYEVAQKVRLGKWDEMAPMVGDLEGAVLRQGIGFAALTPEIATMAGLLDWPHRDPFDRMIAATALVMGVALISADPVFDGVAGLRRVWD